MSTQKEAAKEFVLSLASGSTDPAMMTEDCMCHTSSGTPPFPGAMLCNMVRVLATLFEDDFKMEIDSVIEEGNQVALQAHSRGTLKDGPVYENSYHYALKFRDGKICDMGEYMNSAVVKELILPRLQKAMAAQASS